MYWIRYRSDDTVRPNRKRDAMGEACKCRRMDSNSQYTYDLFRDAGKCGNLGLQGIGNQRIMCFNIFSYKDNSCRSDLSRRKHNRRQHTDLPGDKHRGNDIVRLYW